MRSFYDYQHGLGFSPRVKPIGKAWDNFFSCWRVKCRVTGRDQAHKYHGYPTGRVIYTRASNLKHNVRTIRGTCGHLEYSGGITDTELSELPEFKLDD